MAETTKALTMDELITGLGDIRATTEGKGQEICQAAVNILSALAEDGAQTAEEALDTIHDYAAWQEEHQKMIEVLDRIAQADEERAAKLRQAVKAALEQMA